MLLERSTCVRYTVIIERMDFLQIPYFWLQDEFLGAAAATFADSTGCQMEPVHALLVEVSPYLGSLIIREVLRFDRQTNSHIFDAIDWSREKWKGKRKAKSTPLGVMTAAPVPRSSPRLAAQVSKRGIPPSLSVR